MSNLCKKKIFYERISKKKETFIGSLFPFLKEEGKRIAVTCFMVFFITFSFSLCKLYRESIIYIVLDVSCSEWLYFFTFLMSLANVWFINLSLEKNSMKKGFGVILKSYAIFFMFNAVFLCSKAFLQPKEMFTRSVFIGKTAQIRSIGFLYPLCLILENWILSLFYIATEVTWGALLNYLFHSYLNYIFYIEDYKRYIRLLVIFSNLGAFFSGISFRIFNKAVIRNLSLEKQQFSYFVASLFYALLFLAIKMIKERCDRIFETEIYEGQASGEAQVLRSKKSAFGDFLGEIRSSRLLISLCCISFFYNLFGIINNYLSKSVYKAYWLYIEKFNVPTHYKNSGEIANSFNSFEVISVATAVLVIMAFPYFHVLFEKYSVYLFGSVPIFVSLFSVWSGAFFSILNGGVMEEKILFGISLGNTKAYCKLEAYSVMYFNIFLKIAKYAFFDVMRENLAMKIDPGYRAFYKNISEGIFCPLGKFTGSLYGILMRIIFHCDNARYYTPINSILSIFLASIWGYYIFYLGRNYSIAIKNNKYMVK